MDLLPLSRMVDRIERARADSDTAYFYDLLSYGELVTKLVAAGLIATLPVDREGHRYRLEYGLVRATGLGEWVEAIDDVLTGPASQHLPEAARVEQTALTKWWTDENNAWQYRAVASLEAACRTIDPTVKTARKAQLRSWFHRFTWLRNKTRGHGAATAQRCSDMAEPLRLSIDEITSNLPLFARSWAVIRRNLSGKYRVTGLGGNRDEFAHLTRSDHHSYADGVYVAIDGLNHVTLVSSDAEGTDFFVANGAFTDERYELLSYATDEHSYPSSRDYLRPPAPLPASETEGLAQLGIFGKTFAKSPPCMQEYITRGQLESELRDRLTDGRHPVITLVGLGGAGKTSLALQVLHSLAEEGCYVAIIWFSARDIDLLPYGPRQVKPHILAQKEISEELARLLAPDGSEEKGFDHAAFLAKSLAGSTGLGATLFVFDNFETLRSPNETFRWLDQAIRLPNKILITTQIREFRGDYPVDVRGMVRQEFDALVDVTAARLGVLDRLTDSYRDSLYSETEGHPYVTKILLGEAAVSGQFGSVWRILGAKETILDALFERTYAALPPAAQQVFLLLSSWRAVVPVAALTAAVLRPENERIDIETVVDQLSQSSFIDVLTSETDGERFVSVPLAASLFGRKKVIVSPLKTAIESDLEILRLFGAAQATDVRRGLAPRVESLFRAAAARYQKPGDASVQLLPVLELIAQTYPPARLRYAEFLLEVGDVPGAIEAVRRFLQERPTDHEAWRFLALLSRKTGDYLSEMHALLELARLPGTPFGELSDGANRFNYLLREHVIDVQTDEKHLMADTLRKTMEKRINEASATDLSRLGWLCVHLNDVEAAKEYGRRGLALEPTNGYCKGLTAIQLR